MAGFGAELDEASLAPCLARDACHGNTRACQVCSSKKTSEASISCAQLF